MAESGAHLGWGWGEDGREVWSDMASPSEEVMLELRLMDLVSWASVSRPRDY